MDQDLIKHAIERSDQTNLSVEEALAHFNLAGGAANRRTSDQWISIAFGLARKQREDNAQD